MLLILNYHNQGKNMSRFGYDSRIAEARRIDLKKLIAQGKNVREIVGILGYKNANSVYSMVKQYGLYLPCKAKATRPRVLSKKEAILKIKALRGL